MEPLIWLIIGVTLGGVVVGLWRNGVHERRATRLRERVAAAEAQVRTEEQVLEGAKVGAGEALHAHLVEVTEADSKARKETYDQLVAPVKQGLTGLEDQTKQVELQRAEGEGSLREAMKGIQQTAEGLLSETKVLSGAMRDSRVRGSWGEVQLRRVVELAGMVEQCDFVEQTTVDDASSRLRPDVIVRLPQRAAVVIDAKVPLDAYLEAANRGDAAEADGHLAAHADALAAHVKALAGRRYADHVEGSLEFVVMFVPGDNFLAAAMEQRPSLFEDAVAADVLLATPATLIALLKAVAHGWRQEQLAVNAQEIAKLGAELHERVGIFAEHFVKVGQSLDNSVQAYNKAAGSLESRLLVTGRKLAERGAASSKQLPAAEPIDTALRRLDLPEVEPGEETDPPELRSA